MIYAELLLGENGKEHRALTYAKKRLYTGPDSKGRTGARGTSASRQRPDGFPVED